METDSNDFVTCTNCNTNVPLGKKFCTECGKSMEAKSTNNKSVTNPQNIDETLDSLKKSSKGVMKGMDGFLNKTASSVDKSLNQNKLPSKDISAALKRKREKIKPNPGYLVCDDCGGYYQLQSDEKPDDFSDKCDCGGKLSHYQTLPEDK